MKVGCVVGFPFGAPDSDVKQFETEVAIDLGADEISLVLNPIHLKDGQPKRLFRELRDVVEAAETRPVKAVFAKVFSQSRKLNRRLNWSENLGVGVIELLGGVRPEPLSPEDFMKLKASCPEGFQFKVTGPIMRQSEALGFLKAGVNWIGTPERVVFWKMTKSKRPHTSPFGRELDGIIDLANVPLRSLRGAQNIAFDGPSLNKVK